MWVGTKAVQNLFRHERLTPGRCRQSQFAQPLFFSPSPLIATPLDARANKPRLQQEKQLSLLHPFFVDVHIRVTVRSWRHTPPRTQHTSSKPSRSSLFFFKITS